jgi:hypothetical protein
MVARHRFFGRLAIITVLLLSGWSSFACTCFKADATEMIFEGMVEKQEVVAGSIAPAPSGALSTTLGYEHRLVTIRIGRVYRGDAEGRVTVLTGVGTGDCGFDFENGRTYLVYARG